MPTLQEQLQAAVTQTTTDSGLLHDIVHGDDTTTVNTENGPVKSVAKVISENQQLLTDSLDTLTSIRNEVIANAESAATSEGKASDSETNAAASESAAATSAGNADGSATDAANSAAAALVSENNAAASALVASQSETNASDSETAAALSESNASTSEGNAAASALAASTSESNAAASAAEAAASASSIGYVKASETDISPSALISKIQADTGLNVSLQNPGVNESLLLTPQLATTAEAEAGTVENKLMTPLRVKEAITALAGGGGGLIPLASVTASGVASVTFGSTYVNANFHMYVLDLIRLRPGGAQALIKLNNLTNGYSCCGHAITTNTSAYPSTTITESVFGGWATPGVVLSPATIATAGEDDAIFRCWIGSDTAGGHDPRVLFQGSFTSTSPAGYANVYGGGGYNNNLSLNTITILPASGTIEVVANLYGVAKP